MGSPDDHADEALALHNRRAGSFGARAAAYAEHRPDYPAAAIGWALARVADRRPPVVLDLGAGTGKLTRGLLAVGASVIAVEPDTHMLAELIRRFPDVPAHTGTAEAIPLPDDSVDAIIAGQAFHWFDLDRAYPEFLRVLRPGGVLAALWNTADDSVKWVAGLKEVDRSSVSAAQPPSGQIVLPTHPLFDEHEFERSTFPHRHRRTAESLTATIGTQSHTLVIPPEERAELLDRIMDYLRAQPETAEGEFDLPIVTSVLRTTLRAAD
ncbi:class I SAM-dependent methyltransferase [Nocardia gamkensis]|uniref:Class I SAM-dependent methyltransferase n=1 Tax=Nocardia gamkensis TaxID=352869 RepID=A0A7X6L9D3_9NOCA|nr:class I SAM-dependent methyltransferase [Nocardia gamkensis]NKY30195.1 class I SAM-dependent methyltransferase [Nocardia gamkensis]NQE70831.1 putative methyltransferase [Nocardia gamkensis]